jgi:glucose/arabinose dehydrogenase
MGLKGGDELNFINHYENNLDFGWPYATFGTNYNSLTWPLDRDNKNGFKTIYRLPLFFWIPDIGISSILEIKADQKKDSLKLWNKY